MKIITLYFGILILLSALFAGCADTPGESRKHSTGTVWSYEKAKLWSQQNPWLRGCNFNPSTAINQLETWQAESFDTVTIDRELGYAQSIGLNCMRVFLHHLAWQTDRQGFKDRMGKYLSIADSHGIKTIFVFFDDCWNYDYSSGKQPEPKIGIHNSGWVRDPGKKLDDDPALIDTLELYVKDILTSFANDKRIVMWDLYNEPGNSDRINKSLPLLTSVFKWAREVNLSQPVSSGIWNRSLTDINKFQLENSDIITYHNYANEKDHKIAIDTLRKYNRPLVCTEYMARTRGSRFENIMPLLKKEKVAAINWGLVTGKTNTMYEWDHPVPSGKEPEIWFHDIFRPDGSPFDVKEIDLIRGLTFSAE